MSDMINFPRLMLPFSLKSAKWRRQCVLWANNKTFFHYSLVRKSVVHKKINQDLLLGKLHMSDLQLIINPDDIKAGYIPDRLLHYPIMNSKLNVLRGEESKRLFDYRVIVTNPNAVTEIENAKKQAYFNDLQEIIADTSIDENEYNRRLEELNQYYTFEWLDIREIRANALLNHYKIEYNMPLIFNEGFMDAMSIAEEIYLCDIVSGEPILQKLNPLKVRIFKSGYSNKVEDADMIIIEDYWSPGRVIDTFYDVLTKKDIEYIESMPDYLGQGATDDMGNIDERFSFVNQNMLGDEISVTNGNYYFDPANLFTEGIANSLLPYDLAGNLRVLRLYWKSKRKILKVKSYDEETGEEIYNFYPENYQVNKARGEESWTYWINEAWEGTMIGNEIFVNMRPRPILYNRLSNPSKCHFGIVGTIYNFNDSRPYSIVDMMKPYNYYYDVLHDRLNKAIANNWGSILRMDLAKKPRNWDVDKWIYFARVNHVMFEDSFNEGNIGAATGKLAGGLNNANQGILDTNIGNYIQLLIQLLEFIKLEMSEVVGITRQREGQTESRETVGGVERAVVQSNHITEWLFMLHDDTKRRVIECFLETAKMALKGLNMKFQYILPDMTTKLIDIDGDEFAENDYGLAVTNDTNSQLLNQKLDTLAQAALLNQLLSFTSIMKLYGSSSLSEKQRMIEIDEARMLQRQQEMQQQQIQAEQQAALQEAQMKQMELQFKDTMNQRDNETKLLIAQLQANASKAEDDGIQDQEFTPEAKAKLLELIREFDAKLKLEYDKLKQDDKHHEVDAEIKRKAANKKPANTSK